LVRPAVSEDDLRRVYRLRYRVHVVELGKPYVDSDHSRQELHDALDPFSTVLLTCRDGIAVGTHRVTPAEAPGFRELYGASLRLGLFPDGAWPTLAYASRLVVDASLRGRGRVAIALMVALYEHARSTGVTVCVCHTRPSLVDLLRRVGWRRYAPPFVHRESATVQVPMILVADDLAYLERIGSPLLPAARHIGGGHDGLDTWRAVRERADPALRAVADTDDARCGPWAS
jgi:N-acyl-L-homoserine lactone synthetase